MKAIRHWFHSRFGTGWGAQGSWLTEPGHTPSATAWKCSTCGHAWVEIKDAPRIEAQRV